MERKKRLSIQPKIMLRICLIICIIMLFISFRYQEELMPLKTTVGNVITPMQKGINTLGSYISEKMQMFRNVNNLIIENTQMKEEIESMKVLNSSLTSDMYELNSLRALYQVGEKYSDYPMIAAKVISKESNGYYSIFTIDKGEKDDIMVDMNVLAGNGLCGIVIEVGQNHAKVRSIIDDLSYVSGMFLKTSDTCDIKGDLTLLDTGYIRVETISKNAEIEENYEVVTSHISDKYLQGILIGYVTNIEIDSSDMSKKAYLKPVVDFEHLEEVLIITQLKKPLESLPDENSYERIALRASNLTIKEKNKMIEELQQQIEKEEAEKKKADSDKEKVKEDVNNEENNSEIDVNSEENNSEIDVNNIDNIEVNNNEVEN